MYIKLPFNKVKNKINKIYHKKYKNVLAGMCIQLYCNLRGDTAGDFFLN